MNYEVEKRGLLTKRKYNKLLKFFKQNAKFKESKNRFQLVYLKRRDLKPDPNNPVDLRVRCTNGIGKMVLKYGNWHTGETRSEYEVNFTQDDLPELIKILAILGKVWGTAVYSEIKIYLYQEIEVDLVYIPNDIYYWEFEILVSNKRLIKQAEVKVDNLIKEFKLEPIGSKGMKNYVKRLNKRKFWQFNFENEDINKWLKKHNKHLKMASKKS